VAARGVAGRIDEPDQDDDERGDEQQRGGVVRQAGVESHHLVAAAQRAGDEHDAEHEQRVDEDRAEDRGLGDDDLAGLEREQHTKNSGRFPSVACMSPVIDGPSRRPSCSVAIATIHAWPASASVAGTNAAIAETPGGVARDRGQRRDDRDRSDLPAIGAGEARASARHSARVSS
jgi:hypothetical protein